MIRWFLRVAFILLTVATQLMESATPSFSRQPMAALPLPQPVQSVAQRANDYWIANRPGPEDIQWSRATYFTGNLAHYQLSGDPQYLDSTWTWAESAAQWQLNGGCTTVFADNQAVGQSYLALYALEPQRADLTCLLRSIEQSMSWAWLEVDLGATTNLSGFALAAREDRAYRYLIDVKGDASDPYTLALDRSDGVLGRSTIATTPARFVRLRVIGAANYSGEWVSLPEFGIFGDAGPATSLALNRPVVCSSEPEPQNKCANVVDGNGVSYWAASFSTEFSEESPNWWWVDALYMAAPIYARLSQLEAAGTLPAKAGYSQLLYAKYNDAKEQRGLYDTADHLWYRDSRFLTLRSPNDQKIFWARGNGWVLAAHARLLAILPTSDPHYQEYLSTFQAMADAVLAKQSATGYWNENLADADHCGGPESSGTAFLTYALAWGINHGYLERATFLPAVSAAWEWLATTAVQKNPDGLVGYVQEVGDQPVCSEASPLPGPSDTTDFGVGAFLLAANEVYELAPSITLHLPMVRR
jgi:rhamnogalacturonyl hydrolase YesR